MRSERITPLTEVERDALCELANVAMSRAATNLGQMVGRPILLSVPTCEILAPEMAVETLTKPGNPKLVAVRQDFTGAFSGRALGLCRPHDGSAIDRATSIPSRHVRGEPELIILSNVIAVTMRSQRAKWKKTMPLGY